MTRAKITRADGFACSLDGYTITTYPQGAIVTGKAAEWALRQHAAARMFDPRQETAAIIDLETKAPAKRGRKRKDG